MYESEDVNLRAKSQRRAVCVSSSSASFQCATCRNVFGSGQVKYITKNRIHFLQVRNKLKPTQKDLVNERVLDNQLRPGFNRRLFLKNYDEVGVCPGCYDGFVKQVAHTSKQLETACADSLSLQKSNPVYFRSRTYHESANTTSMETPSIVSHQPRRVLHLRTKSSSRQKQINTRTSITREDIEAEAESDTSVENTKGFYRAGRTASTKCNVSKY